MTGSSQMNTSCYVYVLEVDGVVRYVGRGRRGRINFHLRNAALPLDKRRGGSPRLYSRLAAAIAEGAAISQRKIIENLTGEEAAEREIEEISRHPRDQLWNTILASRPRISDQEVIARKSAAAIRAMSDPDIRARIAAKITALNADPTVRARKSVASAKSWKDPEIRERRLAKIKTARSRPESGAKTAAANKANWQNPEWRERQSAIMRRALNEPSYTSKRSEIQSRNMSGGPAAGFVWWRVERRTERLLELRASGVSYNQIAETLETTRYRVTKKLWSLRKEGRY